MSLVDLGKKLLEASRQGQEEEVKVLMANGAPFTTDWVRDTPLTCVSKMDTLLSVNGLSAMDVSESGESHGRRDITVDF